MFLLDMNDARPMNLILTSSRSSYATFNLNKDVNLYVSLAVLFHHFPRCSLGQLLWTSPWVALVYQPVWGSCLNLVFIICAIKQVIEIKGGQQLEGTMAFTLGLMLQ